MADQLSDDGYAEAVETSFRQLVVSILKIAEGPNPSAEACASLEYATKMLEAGAEGITRLICGIERSNDRGDAFGDAENLVEAALLIGYLAGDRLAKLRSTEKARETKGQTETAKFSAQYAFLRQYIGGRPVRRPYKLAGEIFGTPQAQAELNRQARAAGLEPFCDSTIKRRLNEMKTST